MVRLFRFQGRSGRVDLWLALAAAGAFKLALGHVDIRDLALNAQVAVAISAIVLVLIGLAAGARRLHDLGKPAALLLPGLAALVLALIGLATSSPGGSIVLLAAAVPLGAWSLWLLAEMLSAPGQSAANAFGPALAAVTIAVGDPSLPALASGHSADVSLVDAGRGDGWSPTLSFDPLPATVGRERRLSDSGRPDGLPNRRGARLVSPGDSADAPARTASGGAKVAARGSASRASQPHRSAQSSGAAQSTTSAYAGPDRRSRDAGPPVGTTDRRNRNRPSTIIAPAAARQLGDDRRQIADRRGQAGSLPPGEPARVPKDTDLMERVPQDRVLTDRAPTDRRREPQAAAGAVGPARPAPSPATPTPSPFDAPPAAMSQIYVGPERRVRDTGPRPKEIDRRSAKNGNAFWPSDARLSGGELFSTIPGAPQSLARRNAA